MPEGLPVCHRSRSARYLLGMGPEPNSGKWFPLLTCRHPHIGLPVRHLRLGQQPTVVVLVTSNWRAPALDHIDKETGGAIVVDGGKSLDHCLDVVAAEVFHERRKLCVTASVSLRLPRSAVTSP